MKFHKVFVYGTLKRGEPNHSLFSDSNGVSKFLGLGQTCTKYPLVIGTRYNIPFLVFKPGEGNYVLGEIYEVDEKMLSNLDELEDHPNFYERTLVDIRVQDKNVQENCWVYFLKKFKPSILKKDMLVSYSSQGSHNLPYCERYNRDKGLNIKTEVQ